MHKYTANRNSPGGFPEMSLWRKVCTQIGCGNEWVWFLAGQLLVLCGTHPDNQHKVRNEDEETGFVPASYVIIKEEVSGRSKRLQKIYIIISSITSIPVNPISTFLKAS